MPNLSLNELKQIAKMRCVKNYKNMSRERLLSALDESERSVNNFNNARIKKIREDLNKLRDRFLKSKIKEVRRNLYEIENKKNLFKSKIKEIEQNLVELEESLFKLNMYYDYDNDKYYGIRDIENLFGEFDEDHYKPIKTVSIFNDNCIEYESKGDKDKNLPLKEYLYMIIPYLRDLINTHKTPTNLRIYSRDGVINYETQFGEWKIQLTMSIQFISSKDLNETRFMHTKSDNIVIMIGSKTMVLLMNFLNLFCKNIKKD